MAFAELLLDPPTVTDTGEPRALTPADYGITLRNVCFRHSPAQPWLFDHLTLTIAAGTRVGLVGRSGGGKTSLTRLLLEASRRMDEGGRDANEVTHMDDASSEERKPLANDQTHPPEG